VVISPAARPHVRKGGLTFMHADAAGPAASLLQEKRTPIAMTAISSSDTLDRFRHVKIDLWYAASLELSIGPEADDPLVQAAVHAILEWLRGEARTPRELLEVFGRPHGLLGPQLRFAGSLLIDPSETAAELPRLWWWVVKTAYYWRWLELTRPSPAEAHVPR
jgi:hypothetical protein